MSSIQIPNLPAATSLSGSELLEAVQSGTSVKVSTSQLAALVTPSGGTVTSVDASGGTTGMTFTGGPITLTGTLRLGGTLNIASGGTGQTTASAAFNALSPITSVGDLIIGNGANSATRLPIGASGQVLTSNGTTATWSSVAGSGTVTSVNVSGGTTGLTTSGGPITSSGTITISGTLGATNGGTGLSTYATGDILYASAANTLSKLSAGTNGYILTLAAGVPTWAPNTGGVTSFSAGTTGLTPSTATTGAITLAGTLGTANGGTGLTALGTGVQTALGNATNAASGLLTYSGAFGTPTSLTLTNATGLPVSTGVSGLGTGVATALGTNVGTAGSFVVNGGALGTPSSGTLTNATGLPVGGISATGTPSSTTYLRGDGSWQTISTGLTVGTTPTSGGAAGQLMFDTGTVLQESSNLVWDNTNKALTLGGGTVTTSNPVLNLSQTWNAAGTTFTGLKLNVTNTASAAGSTFIDFQVGGTSKFAVTTTSDIYLSSSTANTGTISLLSGGGTAIYRAYSITFSSLNQNIGFNVNNSSYFGTTANLYQNAFVIAANSSFVWTNTNNRADTSADLFLYRDAAGILAQRNSTSAQTFRAYNTYTDASNYERGVFDWQTTANVLTIGTQNAGTGTARYVKLTSATKAIRYDTGTVAGLPSAATAGAGSRSFVTDAAAPVFGSSVTGGGAVNVPVYSDGTNWIVG